MAWAAPRVSCFGLRLSLAGLVEPCSKGGRCNSSNAAQAWLNVCVEKLQRVVWLRRCLAVVPRRGRFAELRPQAKRALPGGTRALLAPGVIRSCLGSKTGKKALGNVNTTCGTGREHMAGSRAVQTLPCIRVCTSSQRVVPKCSPALNRHGKAKPPSCVVTDKIRREEPPGNEGSGLCVLPLLG